MNNNEYRAYFLAMYNLSGISKSIQSLHAIVEYQLKYPDDENYIEWAKNHKTVIVLDGGTSITQIENAKFLEDIGHPYAVFHEPDLNGSLSSLAFILDDKVFDDKKYPFNRDFLFLLDIDGEEGIKEEWYQLSDEDKETYNLVGHAGLRLRAFVKQFRLASN